MRSILRSDLKVALSLFHLHDAYQNRVATEQGKQGI